MRDTWFWRVFAVLALLVAVALVVSSFASGLTTGRVRAGGEGGFVLEVVADQAGVGKAYLLDTNRKVLILYGSPARHDLTMFASRYIDIDCQATVGKEFPGKARGWSLREVKASMQPRPTRR